MYSVSENVLLFSEDYKTLYVRDDDNNLLASFDLTVTDPPYGVRIVEGNYEISEGLCEGGSVVFALDTESDAGSMSFDEDRLGGLNIIDLRDTGKQKDGFSIDVSLGAVGLQNLETAWGFEVLVNNLGCILVPELS